MADLFAELEFWTAAAGGAILCNPEHESRIKTWLTARGLRETIGVHASPLVPADRILVNSGGRVYRVSVSR